MPLPLGTQPFVFNFSFRWWNIRGIDSPEKSFVEGLTSCGGLNAYRNFIPLWPSERFSRIGYRTGK